MFAANQIVRGVRCGRFVVLDGRTLTDGTVGYIVWEIDSTGRAATARGGNGAMFMPADQLRAE